MPFLFQLCLLQLIGHCFQRASCIYKWNHQAQISLTLATMLAATVGNQEGGHLRASPDA